MLITICKAHNPGDRETFVGNLKYVPGVGPRRALDIYNGATITVEIPAEKSVVASRNLHRLMDAGMIRIEGLMPEETKTNPPEIKKETSPMSTENELELLRRLLGKGGTDEARVIELIREHAARPAHVELDLTAPGIELSGDAIMHHKFPLLASAVAARVNVMLVGPAGSGKTTAAVKAAQALGIPFYGTGAINSEYKLTGFIDAQGRIVSTAFRKAFENGGLFLFDEIDASLPGALLAFNAALANDWMDFPDANIPRHPDFRVVAGANTFGTGADRQYVGRNQLDAASLDRYAVIDWGYDEALEASLLGLPAPTGAPVPASIKPVPEQEARGLSERWIDRVRRVRHAVNDLRVRHVVSPRATIHGAKLLAAGWRWHDTEEAVIWKGLDADSRNKINAKLAA